MYYENNKTEFLKKNKLAMASLLIFIVVYLFVFIMNLSNIMDFGESYDEAVNLTSYADTNVFLFYNDILCQNIQRIDLVPMFIMLDLYNNRWVVLYFPV